MKERRKWNRILAVMLAFAMVMANSSMTTLAATVGSVVETKKEETGPFVYEDGGAIRVTATLPEGETLPEGTTLTAEFTDVAEEALGDAIGEDEEFIGAQGLHLDFSADGETVVPEGTVGITAEFLEPILKGKDSDKETVKVVCLADGGAAEIGADVQQDDGAEVTRAEFAMEGSADFAVIRLGTKDTRRVYTYEDANVSVVATLQYADAVPDDAEFRVTQVTPSGSGYNYDAYMEALNDHADEISACEGESTGAPAYTDENTLLYDIAFLVEPTDEEGNPIAGEKVEYQPTDGSVDISITFKQNQLSEGLGAEEDEDITVVHMPLQESVKASIDSTARATGISAGDVKVEVVAESASVEGGTDQAEFALSDFSVVAFTETGTKIFTPGNSVTPYSVLGDAIYYGIVANEIAHSGHMDTNFATKLLSGDAQTTAGKYTGSHNPGNFIIAEYTGNGWFTDCSQADRPFLIYTTEEAQKKFSSNLTANNPMLYIDTSYTKEQLVAQVSSMISGAGAGLASGSGYQPNEIFYENSNQKQVIDLTNSPAGTYYVDFGTGEYATYAGQASKMYIALKSDQNIVLNIPDEQVELHKFEISIDGEAYYGSDGNNEAADPYVNHVFFNMPNATYVNAASAILGVVLCPKATFNIGATSTGWLVANKVTNGGEWHGVWQEMPGSTDNPASFAVSAEKTVDGNPATGRQVFKFALEKWNGTGWEQIEEKENEGGTIQFSSIQYDEAGEHYYRVTEEEGNDGYIYDETKYIVRVSVTSSKITIGGIYEVTKYSASSEIYKDVDVADIQSGESLNTVQEIVFNNKEYTGTTEIELAGTKTYSKGLAGNDFEFTLIEVNADGSAAAGGYTETVRNAADGSIRFSKISYSEAGTYYYQVSEVNGGLAVNGTVYDSTVYTVAVTVADKGDGTLEANATVTGPSGSVAYTADAMKFVNDVTSVKVNKVDAVDGKVLTGAHLQLLDEAGQLVAEWDSAAEAYELKGLAEGKTYTLHETAAPAGYVVNTTDVTFTLDAKGQIDTAKTTAKVSTDGTVLVEDNMVSSKNASISVTKNITLQGSPMAAKNQTFYVALYADAACTNRVSDVKAVVFRNASSSTVEFKGLDVGRTYYVGECSADGAVLLSGTVADGTVYTVNFASGNQATVTEADGAATVTFANEFVNVPQGFYKQGWLTVTKRLLGSDGGNLESDKVFYAGIFDDASYTKLSEQVSQNIVPLELKGNSSVSAEVEVVVPADGTSTTVYVTEVDEDGTPVSEVQGFAYEVSVDRTKVTMDEDHSEVTVTITNKEYEEVESVENTTTETEKSAKAVKTGDDTPILPYVVALVVAAAAVVVVLLLWYRRRKTAGK